MKIIKVGVLIFRDNVFSSLIEKYLKDIQKENSDKVQFTFFDGKGNPGLEDEILTNLVNNEYDLVLANMTSVRNASALNDIIYKAKKKNIPIIIINGSPDNVGITKIYQKAIIIAVDQEQVGTLQGKMIANAWNADKRTMDKNGDNIMQYIMLKAAPNSYATLARTKYSVLAINEAGIQTKELESVSADGLENVARSVMESLIFRYIARVEVIISNNDAMAIGAIKALQKYGYNKGDKSKFIPVFGIGAISEAQDFIQKGYMSGTVPIDTRAFVDAIYTIGMNLIFNRDAVEGTNYKFDKIGGIIFIPQKENNVQNINRLPQC